ncbi:MAG TPA: hypothetical protein VNS09_24960 [Solirubrobacter sp.]|nr:hypothetical protein [Solirubrobacter sp.]
MTDRFASLSKELQLAALAAAALALSLVLPWYQKSVPQNGKIVQGNVSALGVFTFVEAAILLVSLAVLFLVWARAQRKAFHLPGGDGVAITLAGGWAMLLLVWRMFDRPAVHGVGVDLGIQWGLFVAMFCAAGLIAAGARVRAAHRPEPPNPAADDTGWVAPPPRERPRDPERRPRDATAVTELLRERPRWDEKGRGDETRRMGDEGETRRMRDDEATRRLGDPPRDEATRRRGDPPRDDATRRLDDAPTTRLPDPSDERTARLFDDPAARGRRRRRSEDTEPLWEDDPPAG